MSVFRVILVHIFPDLDWRLNTERHSVQMRENTDQSDSEYGHFSRSVDYRIDLREMQCINEECIVWRKLIHFGWLDCLLRMYKKKQHGLKFKNRPFQKSFFLIFLKYIKFIKYIYFVCIKISDHVCMSEV